MRLPSAGVLILVFASVLFVAGCGSPEEREAEHIRNGKTLYEAGKYSKAGVEFRNALQINPTSVETKYLLGLVLEHQGNLPAALSAFQEVTFQDPNHRDARLKLGQYALMNGDATNAILQAEKAIALDPKKPDAHTMRAAALLLQRKFPEVDAEIKAALALKPDDEDAMVVLASAQILQNRNADAEAQVAKALAANPKSKQLLTFQVKLLRGQGRIAEAGDLLRRLIALEPDNPDYVIALAKDLHAAGKLAEAKQLFRDAIGHSGNRERLFGAYADFLESTIGPAQTIPEISSSAGAFADNPKFKFLLARLQVKAGDYDAATALLTPLIETLTREDEKLEVRSELASIELMRGNKDNALAQLNAIIQDDKEQYNALLLRATIALQDGKYDASIADARSALNEDPRSTGALAVLSQAYIQTGEQDLAIDVLRNLAGIAPDNLDAHLKLASLLATRSPDESVRHLDAAIRIAPDRQDLQLIKAQILIYAKNWDQAELIGQTLLKAPKTAAIGHQILGEAALARKDYKVAISELQSALESGRDFAAIGPQLTQALQFSKGASVGADASGQDKDAAEKMLRGRIAADPKDAASLMLLADLRARADDLKEAEQLFQRAIDADPTKSEAYLNLSRIFNQSGKSKEMAAILEAAALKFPNDRLMQESVAIGREITGDYEGAKAGYEKVLAKWPASMVASNNLAQLIADIWPEDMEQLNRARELLEKFRNKDEPAILDTLGWVQLRLGNVEDAAILLERASSLSPDDSAALYHYAAALAKKNLNDKARTVLQQALAGDPQFRGVADARALAEKLR